MTKQRSLVLVTVDCLRADHVGFLGYPRPTTPFLDTLALHSYVFPSAIVAGAPTYFSFPAILASRFPLALGRDVLGIAPTEPTLASALQACGWTTAAFLAGNPYLSQRCGYDEGFDTFRDILAEDLPCDSTSSEGEMDTHFTRLNRFLERNARRNERTAAGYEELYFLYCQWLASRRQETMEGLRPYPAADTILDQASSWISSQGDQPFFLWLHLMDPHHPYYPPEEALAAIGRADISPSRARFWNASWSRGHINCKRLQRYRDEIVTLYDAGIQWADTQISRLIRTLQHSCRWDDTVFAVTGDHGEEFLEHGRRFHAPEDLADELIHVPLLLRVPGMNGTILPNEPFSLIHLAPTLLDVLDVPSPTTFRGASYWQDISKGQLPKLTAVTECIEGCNNPLQRSNRLGQRLLSVRDASYKVLVRFGNSTDIMFDLKNDPGEYCPLPRDAKPAERAQLLRVAREHVTSPPQASDPEFRLRACLREFCQQLSFRRNAAEPLLGEIQVH